MKTNPRHSALASAGRTQTVRTKVIKVRWHEVRFLDARAQRWSDQKVARLRAEGVLRPPHPANPRSEGSPDNPSAH